MDDFVFLSEVHRQFARNALAAQGAERTHLEQLSQEAWARLTAAERGAVELLFDPYCSPGYVLLGSPQASISYPSPDLEGLFSGWEIFNEGVQAGHTLHATTLLRDPGRHPGNALRNQLAAAAAWLDTRSPRLASALRRPSIALSSDGRIRHEPARGLRICLSLP